MACESRPLDDCDTFSHLFVFVLACLQDQNKIGTIAAAAGSRTHKYISVLLGVQVKWSNALQFSTKRKRGEAERQSLKHVRILILYFSYNVISHFSQNSFTHFFRNKFSLFKLESLFRSPFWAGICASFLSITLFCIDFSLRFMGTKFHT